MHYCACAELRKNSRQTEEDSLLTWTFRIKILTGTGKGLKKNPRNVIKLLRFSTCKKKASRGSIKLP